MKFSVIIPAGLAAIASAASIERRDDLPKLFDLTCTKKLPDVIYSTLMYANGMLKKTLHSLCIPPNANRYIRIRLYRKRQVRHVQRASAASVFPRSQYPSCANFHTVDSACAFTSFHSSPTGWQNLYIFPNKTKPVGFTTPHSAKVPKGAVTTGFVKEHSNFLYDNGKSSNAKWAVCPVDGQDGTWQLYWNGSSNKKALHKDCVYTPLKIGKTKECRN
jgi:hypothetical protein